MSESKHTLIAMQENLGHGRGGDILITTQERVDANEEPIARTVVDKEYAEFLCRACNAHEELVKACNVGLQVIKSGLLPEDECHNLPCIETCESYGECTALASSRRTIEAALAKAEEEQK